MAEDTSFTQLISDLNEDKVKEQSPFVATPAGGVVTGEFEGTFKKIKIENGLITEFEVE